MFLEPFEKLPVSFQCDEVKLYYNLLTKKRFTALVKRTFDVILSAVALLIGFPFLLIIYLLVRCTSKGPGFYRQVRVGRYGKTFRIFKFRTMVVNADKIGTEITVGVDPRITKVGFVLRKFRLDELPQMINIFIGDMSFVGPRPEVERYVKEYTPEMMATLLTRPGMTCSSSIEFGDENAMLEGKDDPEEFYVTEILPAKMLINLDYIYKFSVKEDIKILFKTVLYVFKSE